ncbi:serine/threonine-protein phosphatase [Actinospica sp. MGRD01-02]|uniref:Serine/threonine-protein phosphatase n=1 Tax=Actinospica acidithermotolerans TaxID=2828514 RepID=A0A941IFI3_9ACTN|nr:PP2C family protein-serine/threonine phosphatase [Actinospica acidithermotolerans]MBR7825074.1 serine/threonine-protein phosphatase [Actinospica acidithermotolerans]
MSSPRTPLWRHPRAITAGMLVVLATMLLIDEFTPPSIRLGPVMVAVPALAAVFCTPLEVLLILAATLVAVILAADVNQQLDQANFPVQLGAIALISIAALGASIVRARRERDLAKSRTVAEVTQRLLLRPLPRRIGELSFSSLYLAADEEALIGGDLYGVIDTGDGVRVLIGDAQGKGLAALEMASYVLGAFRRLSRRRLPLTSLAAAMDEEFRTELAESAAMSGDPRRTRGGSYQEEGFVTALLLEIPKSDGALSVLNLGHTEPFLIRQGTATPIRPGAFAAPLGLGDLSGPAPAADAVPFPPDATILLYTDGLIEARNRAGEFYPFAERLNRLADLHPDDLLRAIHDDLRRYVGTRLSDDIAMVAIRRSGVPSRVESVVDEAGGMAGGFDRSRPVADAGRGGLERSADQV